MANLVNGAVFRYKLEVTLAALDNNGAIYERTKSFEFAAGIQVYADALAAVGAFVTAFAAIEEADIVAYTISVVFKTRTGPPTLTGNLRKEAILTLMQSSGIKKLAHTIFSPHDSLISGKSVVITAPLQTYLDMFELGGDFAISDGEQISTDEPTRIVSSRIRHVVGPKG